jgi:retron-type reverse transcriptase
MQSAETVLTVIRKCGSKGLPLERVYRQMFNRNLYELAYGRIYRNTGALTPGVTEETADDMSIAKMEALIEQLRSETFRWHPMRRVYIAKKNATKTRPLGIPMSRSHCTSMQGAWGLGCG